MTATKIVLIVTAAFVAVFIAMLALAVVGNG